MSQRDMWKTVHLLYLNQKGPEGLPYSALERAGISCYSDTVEELEHSGILRRVKDSGLVLSHAARKMLQISIFGNRRWTGPVYGWIIQKRLSLCHIRRLGQILCTVK
jgi:hypothetical protein